MSRLRIGTLAEHKTFFLRLSAVAVALILLASQSSWLNKVVATVLAPEIWRIAPPAPKISETDRLAELRARREEVMKRMGDKGIMVLFATEPRVYTNDVDYHYRQENDLYYLTGVNPAMAAIITLTAGSSGTLMTPMAANYNIVPAALLEMRDQYGVIKFQIPYALTLWSFHVLLLWLLVKIS